MILRNLIIAGVALLLGACDFAEEEKIEGETMGTFYAITVYRNSTILPPLVDQRQAIEHLLAEIIASQSTWDENSLISRFNADPASIRPFEVDDHFVKVMNVARDVFWSSKGAFNPAVAPLIEAWGFDKKPYSGLPDPAEINALLKVSDFRAIDFDPSQKTLARTRQGIKLNFSALAKGYAVDALSKLLLNAGYKNYLVNIGGEVYARGRKGGNEMWQVGIETPDYSSKPYNPDPHMLDFTLETEVMRLQNRALATSGDYRNFMMVGRKPYSHIIDPRSGEPTESGVASASVIARSTVVADAWATALMVIGREGIDTCNRLGMACMLILHGEGEEAFEKIISRDWLGYYASQNLRSSKAG